MNKFNFIPYSFMEQNLKRNKKIVRLIFLITLILLFFLIGILKSNISRLSNLKKEEKIINGKVHSMYLNENNKKIEKHIEVLSEIIKENDTFHCIILEDNTLWIEGMDRSIKGCKQTIMKLEEKSSFRVISLKGPEKRGDNYHYKVGVVIDEK